MADDIHQVELVFDDETGELPDMAVWLEGSPCQLRGRRLVVVSVFMGGDNNFSNRIYPAVDSFIKVTVCAASNAAMYMHISIMISAGNTRSTCT